MKNFLIVLVVLGVIGLGIFGWYRGGYDRMVGLNQRVQSSWAQVESQLQRRFDLIPNLVEAVKGYATHEKELLTEVTRLRSQWGAAASVPEKVEAANSLNGVLSRLLLVSESYPDLKANENFRDFQAQLEGTENRIAVERMRYNQAVESFNAFQLSFFGRFFAGQTGLTQSAVYFKSDEAAKQAPKVKF